MKVNIPLPFGHRKNKFNLRYEHVTTSDFGYLSPIHIMEVVPGDDITASLKSFSRLAPLPVPTFADVTMESCGFYVPLRQLWKDGREFFASQKYYSEIVQRMVDSEVPVFTNSMVVQAFRNAEFATKKAQLEQEYDFSLHIITSSGGNTNLTVEKYVFTHKGRLIYKLLKSLGYEIIFDIEEHTEMSLLPLLAFIHIVHEYYFPATLYPDPELQILLAHESYFYRAAITRFTGDGSIDKKTDGSNIAYQLFSVIGLPLEGFLDDDYFTLAWRTPTGNTAVFTKGSQNTPINKDIVIDAFGGEEHLSSIKQTVQAFPDNDTFPTKYPNLYAQPANYLTNVGLNLLKAVTNFVTRNSVAGNKMVDQFFARFGVRLPDLNLQRPTYLGKVTQQVQVSDIYSTASVPDGSAVGDYAGRGQSYGDGQFKFDADEYGYFIIINMVKPHTGVVTGRKRHVLHKKLEEFYCPEYDCIGVQAIRRDEVLARITEGGLYSDGNKTYKPNSVFGYAPRYAEYKFGFDTLSGDFSLGSYYKNLNSYHLFRDVSQDNALRDDFQINARFLSASPSDDYNGFNRIFSYSGNEFDHFTNIHEVNVIAYRNMHLIGETLDLEDVHGEGRTVDVRYGGSRI